MLLSAGCITTPEKPAATTPTPQPVPQKCRTVMDDVPKTELKCGDVVSTEEVCGLRKLNYTKEELPKIDLCISDGACTGKPLGDCQACVKAMSRCVMVIHNTEEVKSGTWSVAANYTLGNSGFNKDPITVTIPSNGTGTFDFNQIYNTNYPINSASCKLLIVKEPTTEDCRQESRTHNECKNVTTITQVPRTVCE